jgi:hypothetical protein
LLGLCNVPCGGCPTCTPTQCMLHPHSCTASFPSCSHLHLAAYSTSLSRQTDRQLHPLGQPGPSGVAQTKWEYVEYNPGGNLGHTVGEKLVTYVNERTKTKHTLQHTQHHSAGTASCLHSCITLHDTCTQFLGTAQGSDSESDFSFRAESDRSQTGIRLTI